MSFERGSRALWIFTVFASAVAFWPDRVPVECRAPVESASDFGWTHEVRCGQGVGGPEIRGPARMLFGLGLDANTASARSLQVLPGIGPALAGRLVATREKRAFCAPHELERVPGIGPVLRARIAPELRFAAAACPSGRSPEGV